MLFPVTIVIDETHNLPLALVCYVSEEGVLAGSKHTPCALVFISYVDSTSVSDAMSRRHPSKSLTSRAVKDIDRLDRLARLANQANLLVDRKTKQRSR